MRFVYYRNAAQEKAVAFFFDHEIVDVSEALIAAGVHLTDISPEKMTDLSNPDLDKLEQVYAGIKDGRISAPRLPLHEVELLPLISRDDNVIFCIGRNYKGTGAEMNKASQKDVQELERPAIFHKPNRSIALNGQSIIACSDDTCKLDYEGEIGLVIGKAGKDIPLSEAESYIYGYTVCNDVSARDVMKAYYQICKGKSMDTFAPIGPCISTRAEIADYRNIKIRTSVNGFLRQEDHSGNLIFDFPTIISHLSRGTTLLPGDIIMTGTPKGIGAASDPPVFLQHGDVVEVFVEGVGTLQNRVEFYSREH